MRIVAKWETYPSIKTTTPGNYITTTSGRFYWRDDDSDYEGCWRDGHVPPDFPFDGASIPFPLQLTLASPFVLLGMNRDETRNAAANHDKDYRLQTPKELADAIFGALLRARADEFKGINRWRRRLGARLAEWAVRVGGHAAYAENGRKKEAAIERAKWLIGEEQGRKRTSLSPKWRDELTSLEKIYGIAFWRVAE